jgi:hypothetical protein
MIHRFHFNASLSKDHEVKSPDCLPSACFEISLSLNILVSDRNSLAASGLILILAGESADASSGIPQSRDRS